MSAAESKTCVASLGPQQGVGGEVRAEVVTGSNIRGE